MSSLSTTPICHTNDILNIFFLSYFVKEILKYVLYNILGIILARVTPYICYGFIYIYENHYQSQNKLKLAKCKEINDELSRPLFQYFRAQSPQVSI